MSMWCNWPRKDGKPVAPKRGHRPVVKCGPSRTKQSFKDRVNINKIIARYERTGLIETVTNRGGQYMDVSDLGDFHENLNKVNKAKEAFLSLPANIRNRFRGDPGELLAFLRNPDNRQEAIDLGLLVETKQKAPVAPEVAPEGDKTPAEGV